jgi:VIT1/CCC1 family predicted Fe2+/Mn2+ transporter
VDHPTGEADTDHRLISQSFSGSPLLKEMQHMSPKTQPEPHFTASDIVHDIVIGMSDGLTVPFAIAPGMSGVAVASQVVVVAGLAEITAGSISMGLGGYLSGRTNAEHYDVERKREEQETFL